MTKLIFLTSACIYTQFSNQPLREEDIMNGKVDPTHEGYAIAKIAGIEMCKMYNRQYKTQYVSLIPCNLYGIGDNFDPHKSHVVPALIRRFYEAKINDSKHIEIWGSGNARRELLYTDDLAEACLFFINGNMEGEIYNIGTGFDISINELAHIISDIVGYSGKILFDTTKPDGMPQRLMDVSKAAGLGWSSKTELHEGIQRTYEWYLKMQ